MAKQDDENRPAQIWVQSKHFEHYLHAISWVLDTIEPLRLVGGTWYRIIEAWPSQATARMAASTNGQPVDGGAADARMLDMTPERLRAIVWNLLVANNNEGQLDRIFDALTQGAAKLRQKQEDDAPVIWAVERAREGNTDIVRVVIPVQPVWIDWPA